MNRPVEGYIPLQQAADKLGVSRQAVYRRLSAELSADSERTATGQTADSKPDSAGQSADSRPVSIVRGKKRYISMDWVLAERRASEPDSRTADNAGQSADSNPDSSGQSADNERTVADSNPDRPIKPEGSPSNGPNLSSQARIRELEAALLAAQGEANTLRATVTAQEAHIDSLRRALDAQQALHMASLQQRLPAPRGGLFGWLFARKERRND